MVEPQPEDNYFDPHNRSRTTKGEPMHQDNETNPIAEIFDEMFTLMEDLETRSVAVLEYLKEQGGVSEEKLAPYRDRAAASSDVRWRAARARMEHLLAPKPKSATEVGKDEKTKAQGQKDEGQKQKSESKGLGKELASPPHSDEKSSDRKGEESKDANAAAVDAKSKEKEQTKQDKEPATASTNAGAQASALNGEGKSDKQKADTSKKPTAQSDNGTSTNQTGNSEKPQSQKAVK
jgi:hypothetical protein